MQTKRNPYLIHRSLRQYLMASVASMALIYVQASVTGILTGNLIGPETLSAINICLPATSAINAIGNLFAGGAMVMIARALGRQDKREADKSFSAAFIALVMAGLLLAIFAGPLSAAFADFLCLEESLQGLCQEYLLTMFLCSMAVMLQFALGVFTEVSGSPETAARGAVISTITTILCNILYVWGLGAGIRGAALATATGMTFSGLYYIRYLVRKRPFSFIGICPDFFAVLRDSMKLGVVQMAASSSVTLIVLTCNFFIQYTQGTAGVFVMSIGCLLVQAGYMVAVGVSLAMTGIGGMLAGQEDYIGLQMLFRRGLAVSLLGGAFFFVMPWIIPEQIALLFGANTPELLELSVQALPMIVFFIVAGCLALPAARIHQLLGFVSLAIIDETSQLVSLLLAFLLVAWQMPEKIWYAFPLASLLSLAYLIISWEVTRCRLGYPCMAISLIPTGLKREQYDTSVECQKEAVVQCLRETRSFLKKHFAGAVSEKAELAAEEMLLNILEHSGRGRGHYIDIIVSQVADKLLILLRDAGTPFDPVHCEKEKQRIGLKLVSFACEEMSYQYAFGQNMTYLKWKVEHGSSQDA